MSRHLQWQASSRGTWERDLDECEDFYRLSTRKDRGCFPVTGCASFQIRNPESAAAEEDDDRAESALRRAWSLLRHEHPTLHSRMEHDEETGKWKRVYRPFRDGTEEERWLDSTFQVIDLKEEGRDALQWFNYRAPPFEVPTIFLVKSPWDAPPQTVFLRCPHDITDGVGILQLVDQLFGHAALSYEQRDASRLPDMDSELTRLSPSLRHAASIPGQLSESQTKRLEEIQTQNAAIYNHPAMLSLPPSASTIPCRSPRSRMHRLSICIPKAVSARVLSACKAMAPGISVTHVFTSALALALCEVQPQKQNSYPVRYVSHVMINLRPYCPTPYDSPDHAAAAYHTISAQALGIDLVRRGLAVAKEGSQETNELPRIATQVRDFFKELRPVSSSSVPSVSSEEVHEQVFSAPSTFKFMSPPPGCDPHSVGEKPFCPVALSSIGNLASLVAANHGVFELANVWAASEPIGAGVALFVGSWNGEIQLSSVFNAKYHDPEDLEQFLELVLDQVYKGLDIKYVADEANGTNGDAPCLPVAASSSEVGC